MDDRRLRHEIYTAFAATGEAPTGAQLAQWAGSATAVHAGLRRLHDIHAIVLDASGTIRMALPFSAVATDHRVTAGSRSWWANCAWDALAIPALLGIDAAISSTWLDTGEPVDLAVVDGDLTSTRGFVRFAVPARQWWDDIVET